MIESGTARAGEWLPWQASRHQHARLLTRYISLLLAADARGVAAVLVVTTVATFQLVAGGTLVGQDSATQFYPWYLYLGDQLRSFEIPGWNPFQFAGAPFAADPQSGWMYLPAMVIFTLLPVSMAAPVFLWVHLALAGLGTYALSRTLSMPVIGAVTAATAYQLSGPVYGRSVCCPAGMEVAVWTPWVLAGADVAIRSGNPRVRLGGWVLGGFALSQALAAWLGQGSYYLIMAMAAFIAWRTLISPSGSPSLKARFRNCLMHGAAITAIGMGIGAAGLLPRFDYVARSNLADGQYGGSSAWAAQISGVTQDSVINRLLTPTLYYPGTATLVLAVIGVLIARKRFAAPFFVTLGICAVVLSSPTPTPLHHLLFALLPRFEELHQHWPERVSLVAYIAPAILAGATVSILVDRATAVRRFLPWTLAPVAILFGLHQFGAGITTAAILIAAGLVVLVIALMLWPLHTLQQAAPVILVAVIAADLLMGTPTLAAEAPYGGFHRVDLADYYDSTGAAGFLKGQSGQGPFRAFGYDPSVRAVQDGQTVLYRHEFDEPEMQALNVNNRAMVHGIYDVQGYNPVQVQRYVELIEALNGHGQDYHDANVFPGGLQSPLLDLLNVRFVIVPADADPKRADIGWLLDNFTTRYLDAQVRVLENPDTLPRAWIVHDVRSVGPGEALDLLADGAVDPRQTALIERGDAIPLTLAAPSELDQVTIRDHQPDRITIEASTSADGLLVLSEIHDPGWRAFVDGVEVPVHLVNHAFQAIQMPAGSHEVELQYETPWLGVGIAITAGTVMLLVVAAVLLYLPTRGTRRRSAKRTP